MHWLFPNWNFESMRERWTCPIRTGYHVISIGDFMVSKYCHTNPTLEMDAPPNNVCTNRCTTIMSIHTNYGHRHEDRSTSSSTRSFECIVKTLCVSSIAHKPIENTITIQMRANKCGIRHTQKLHPDFMMAIEIQIIILPLSTHKKTENWGAERGHASNITQVRYDASRASSSAPTPHLPPNKIANILSWSLPSSTYIEPLHVVVPPIPT